MGSHSVSMVCKHLSASAFSFASTEYPQGSSETLQTIGVCNGALLNVTSLPAGMPSQVTMQSQLQVMEYLCSLQLLVDSLLLGFQLELDRMREWDGPQKKGYEYTKTTKTCGCIPCGSTSHASSVSKFRPKELKEDPAHCL